MTGNPSDLHSWGRGPIMKKTIIAFACLVLFIAAALTASGKEIELFPQAIEMLP